ncbi:unnamed protein product [Aphis gossypii]|uniref:DUF4817 domain-containing protein n=1 Tax=Aphis gossypii TaxID=80765 RepID=A0A9P0J338_APHGO|nr:unnamed protein product [Aphis gossypii]
MAWTSEHRTFVIGEYIRKGSSAISTQRAFCIRFHLTNMILFWIEKQCSFESIALKLNTQTRFKLD